MSTSNSIGGTVPSELNPTLTQELNQYAEDQALLAQSQQQLQQMAGAMKNTGNAMLEAIQVFNLYQNIQGAQLKCLADVDNVESTFRSMGSQAQSDFNNMQNGQFVNADGKSCSQDMVDQVNQMQAFISYEQGQGNQSILDQASLSSLQSAIGSVTGAFGSSWGNASAMDAQMTTWNNQISGGQNVPAVKNIQDGFQTANQLVSELSSSTNSQMQFVENQIKQDMGEESSAMQSYLKMNSNTIRHFTSS